MGYPSCQKQQQNHQGDAAKQPTVLRMSTSGEIAGIIFEKAFAIAVMAFP
jgi:hypothetical protein